MPASTPHNPHPNLSKHGSAENRAKAREEAVAAVIRHKSTTLAAAELGITRSMVQRLLNEVRAAEPGRLPEVSTRDGWEKAAATQWAPADDWQQDAPAAEFDEIPDAEPTYEELKARCMEDFRRLDAHKQASKLIKVRVKIDGPYGILFTGDPHLDSAGTDWPLLDQHVRLTRTTPGLFATNIGDVTNNWVGRLARLYGEQNMSRKRAVIMTEGFLRETNWLWLDPGNHDIWSGADDPVRWIAKQSGIHHKWQGSRLHLVSPTGQGIIVNSRHDHPGQSMYHPTHGPLKAALMDGNGDDIYSCGHIHSGAYHMHVHPDGRFSHLIRLSAYKIYDSFKDEKGFKDAHLPAVVALVDPHATEPRARTTIYPDPAWGAEVLTWMRARHAQGKKATPPKAA